MRGASSRSIWRGTELGELDIVRRYRFWYSHRVRFIGGVKVIALIEEYHETIAVPVYQINIAFISEK